jgi:tetratricopeptide (TPR) repeat protein
MNKSVIYNCISYPSANSVIHEIELKELTSNFPYFQTAQILFGFALKSKEDYRFEKQLKNISLQSFDRKFLWEKFNIKVSEFENQKADKPKNSEEKSTTSENNVNPIPEEIEVKNTEEVQSVINVIPKPLELVKDPEVKKAEEIFATEQFKTEEKEQVINSFHTFSEWLNLHQNSFNKSSVSKGLIENKQSKTELIEKFIQTEPKISKPTKATFFSPQVMAKKSIEENDEIVSETLATIYANQGDIQRAVRVYKKLGLLNPEKSAYFAALIKKIENNIELS